MRRCFTLLGTSDFVSQVSRARFRQRPGFFQGVPERPISRADALAGPGPMALLKEERRREPAVLLAEAEREVEHVLTSSAETEAAMAALMPLDEDSLATATTDAPASSSASKSQPSDETTTVGQRKLSFDGHSFDDDVADLYEDETALQSDAGGAKTAVPRDTVSLVTDEFKRLREKEVRRRRQLLHELLNPNPAEYTYDGKLVPVPPLSFGTLSPEAAMLGHEMFTGRPYQLVRESPSTDHFFEINDLYIEIVFLGRANAGKSSLINALVGGEVAKTSSIPHSTRSINFYQNASPDELAHFARGNPNRLVKLPAGGKQFTLVDVPGFGIEGMSDQWRDDAVRLTDSYLNVRRSVNTAFLCVDANKGLTPSDVTMLEWFARIHGLVWIVVTKADTVPHSRLCDVMSRIYKLITKSRKKHKNVYPYVLPVSAHTGENIDALRALIVETSGVIPGSQMRDIMRKKSHEALAAARELETQRLRRNALEAAGQRQLEAPEEVSSASATAAGDHLDPATDSPLAELVNALAAADTANPADNVVRSHTYGHVKGNIGAVMGEAKRGTEGAHPPSTPKQHAREPSEAASVPSPREINADPVGHRLAAKRRPAPRTGTTVLVEQRDGSVVGARGGHTLSHKAALELHEDRPAKQRLRRRGASQQWGGGATKGQIARQVTMSRADRAGYKKHNGGMKHETPEHFWNEVEARKADSAVHTRPKSIRHDKMLEFSHGSRVQWGAMPRGGLRKYGHDSSKQPSFGSGPSRVKGL